MKNINDQLKINLLKQLDNNVLQYLENINWYYPVKDIIQDFKIFQKTTYKIIKQNKVKSFYLNSY